MNYLSPDQQKLLQEFKDRGKPLPHYDRYQLSGSRPAPQGGSYHSGSIPTDSDRPHFRPLIPSKHDSAILIEDNSHMLVERNTIPHREPERQLNTVIFNSTPRDSRLEQDWRRNHSSNQRPHTALSNSRTENEWTSQSKASASISYDTRDEFRRSSYENQRNKENLDLNRSTNESFSSKSFTSTQYYPKFSMPAERKTLQDLNPNEYQSRVLSYLNTSDKHDHYHYSSVNRSQRPSFNSNNISMTQQKERSTTNYSQKLDHYLNKEKYSLDESLRVNNYNSYNAQELDDIYMNYLNRTKVNPVAAAEPTQSKITSHHVHEDETQINKKSNKRPESSTTKASAKPAMKGGKSAKRKKNNQNLSVRFSLNQEQQSRRDSSGDRGRLSSPPAALGTKHLKEEATEQYHRHRDSSTIKQQKESLRPHSAATRASNDLNTTMPLYLANRNHFASDEENILNKSMEATKTNLSRLSQTGIHDDSRTSIKPKESSKTQKSKSSASNHSQKNYEETRKEIERRYKLGLVDKTKFWNLIQEHLKISHAFRADIRELLELN